MARTREEGRQDTQGLGPRKAALAILRAVYLDRQMVAHLDQPRGLAPEDRARAERLAQAVLRHTGRIDTLLSAYLERRPHPLAQNILRLGVAELLLDEAEAYGVVNAAVAIAKQGRATGGAAGLINAVLRKVDQEGRARWAQLAPQTLPVWLRKAVGGAWGETATRAIEAAHEAGAPIDITLRDQSTPFEAGEPLPTGSIRLPRQTQISTLGGYEAGAFWVQDAAAALPVKLLGDVSGQPVLDLCAAPGGKTMQLAAAGAKVTALDLSKHRMGRVRVNLRRTGLSADMVTADALEFDSGPWPIIVLDAPCSATGTLRRHPDLPFVKSAREVEALTKLQMQMLDHAISLLDTGGRMVFCTCSLLPNEGENQIKAALKRHANLAVLPLAPKALGVDPAWISAEGGLRILPHYWQDRGGIDGFYMALLQKR